MIAALYNFLLNRPALLREVGALLWRGGCLGLLAGIVAKLLDAILDVVTTMSHAVQHVGYQTLFSGIPVWWVPDSLYGVAAYVGMMLVGQALHVFAAHIERLLRA